LLRFLRKGVAVKDPLAPNTRRYREEEYDEPPRIVWSFVGEMIGLAICVAVIGVVMWKVLL
jgi:hypothetical protein